MRVRSTTEAPADTGADTIAVGVFEGEPIAHDVDGVLQALVDSGEARSGLRKVAVAHAGGRRYVLAGLGSREKFDDEAARVAAAAVVGRAKELGTRTLCWEVPHHVESPGFVEGTVLAAYEYRAFKAADDDAPAARGARRLRPPRHERRGRRGRDRGGGGQRGARPPERPRQRADAARAGRARPRARGRDRRRLGPRGDRGRRHGRVRRRGARQPRGAAADHDPLRPAGRRRPAARLRRQGRHLRLGRDLDQARREDERDEVRHVGRRRRARGDRARSPASGSRPAW